MVLHNHQPCDNFGWVFEEAFEKAYDPFLRVLEKYPRVTIAMHYSGSLLEWLVENMPEFISRVNALVKNKQVELFTGGFYEPVLPIIPDRDKQDQIRLLTDFIKQSFGYNSRGIWLTERVWENRLADIFCGQGLQYTVVDENHIVRAGIFEKPIHGYYQLDNGFQIFPADKKLRYIIPFAKVKDIADYFESICASQNDTCMVFADDGEKFGFLQNTYNWVYKKGWLDEFFGFLSNEDSCVESASFSDVRISLEHRGIVNIPPSSYSEMMEWSKGDFNNFFTMYPEANIMRNRMIIASNMIHDAYSSNPTTSRQKDILIEAKKEVFRAQSGCAYWHGIFGGLYLKHLRSGVYRHLIRAQNLLDKVSVNRGTYFKTFDLDGDSKEEIVVGNNFIDLYIKPDNKGAIFGLDNKSQTVNMINTITRRREPYHVKLFKKTRPKLNEIKKKMDEGKYVNVHDVLGVKSRWLKKYLVYDDSEKASLIDYLISGRFGIRAFARSQYNNAFQISQNPYRVRKIVNNNTVSVVLEKEEDVMIKRKRISLYIRKALTVSDEAGFCVEYTLRNSSPYEIKSMFGTEYNWSVANTRFFRNREFRNINSFVLHDEWTGSDIKYLFGGNVKLWVVPAYTLSESEKGLEKNYQYLSLFVQRPVLLNENESITFCDSVLIDSIGN